jgi:dTDP-4-amino-4,6-dideoxy-D-galactose acyltransferase
MKFINEAFELLRLKQRALFIYSPFPFIKNVSPSEIFEFTIIKPFFDDCKKGRIEIRKVTESGFDHYFFIRYLKWDTNYFGYPTYRIELIIYDHRDTYVLNKALNALLTVYENIEKVYILINIPAEDLLLIQAIGSTKFKLIETRLNYYLSDLRNQKDEIYKVRDATIEDIESMKNVAMIMRNQYDRVHADPAFSSKQADEYIGKFVEESVKGFADIVLVPDIANTPAFGFLAGKNPVNILGNNISKLVIAAVDNSNYKGWLFILLSAMILRMKQNGSDYLTTITQASNRPAIRTWEKAGFRLGFTTHLFSFHNY